MSSKDLQNFCQIKFKALQLNHKLSQSQILTVNEKIWGQRVKGHGKNTYWSCFKLVMVRPWP